MPHYQPIYDPFDDKQTDKYLILEKTRSVPCRICWEIYGRWRLTVRYCDTCERGFCDGEHGRFQSRGFCIRCYKPKSNELRK